MIYLNYYFSIDTQYDAHSSAMHDAMCGEIIDGP